VPVLDADHRPLGVLSVDDLARVADRAKRSGVDRDFVHTFAEISRPLSTSGRKTPDAAAP
jgi:hypothetical protein